MKLLQLLQYVPNEKVIGDTDVEIEDLCFDSRKAKKGDCFFCYKGYRCDSYDMAEAAVKEGVQVVVAERLNPALVNVTQVVVADGRKALTEAARAFYGFADKKLKLIAVTGTNGKTTTTYMLDAIFSYANKKTAVIGTLGVKYGDKFIAPTLTTPDPVFLHRIFADMVQCGVEYVFMEVSAHALYYDKIKGLKFEASIFTNCTRDHLDFFGDMKSYAACKKLLFNANVSKVAVVNVDDNVGLEILKDNTNVLSFGLENPADVFAVNVEERIDGSNFVLNLFDEICQVELCLPGMHNVYNAMGAAVCASLMGITPQTVAEGLSRLKGVDGRLERVGNFNGADIFVDFAHTPDGLEQSLSCLKKLCKNRLILVFGCGGDRDRTKRPMMGAIACKYADFCIVTSDNPRYEDPYGIISEIEQGMKSQNNNYVTITDRETAVSYAIRVLQKGDILLVAGKGGEQYQEIMGIKHSYNDNNVIKKLIG